MVTSHLALLLCLCLSLGLIGTVEAGPWFYGHSSLIFAGAQVKTPVAFGLSFLRLGPLSALTPEGEKGLPGVMSTPNANECETDPEEWSPVALELTMTETEPTNSEAKPNSPESPNLHQKPH